MIFFNKKAKPIKTQLYSKCSELPLYIFLKVYTTDDLSFLTISGTPTDEELQEAWDILYSEYVSLSNDTSQNYLISCLKDISFLGNKVAAIESIVAQLAEYRDQRLVDMLHMLGFKFQYDIFGSDRYKLELKLTITQSKVLLMQLKQRENELSELQKGNDTIKENEFDLLLSELSKFQGYRLDPQTTMVSEFCAIVTRFKNANTQK